MSSTLSCKFYLEILADADPVVLIRLIERIQSLGLTPNSLIATWREDDRVSIQFVCCGLNEASAETLERRIEQWVTVHEVQWHTATSGGIGTASVAERVSIPSQNASLSTLLI